jgi:D-glucosaminate-6-phosphate ammonia-lyase
LERPVPGNSFDESPPESTPSTIYRDLRVPTFINAHGHQTVRGGSRMRPPVLAAMTEAARHFVHVEELQARVGERLAALTRNEAAYVTSGAAAALTICTAACMIDGDPGRARQLPDLRGLRDQVVMQRAHRNPYDYAVQSLHMEIVEVGYSNYPTYTWELEHAITDRTAAVLHVAGDMFRPGPLPLPEVVAIAHRKGVPVIVDAAAQLPPRENLWRLTEMGADLVIFSGGKDLRGPQSSGLIVGRPDLIAGCTIVGAPKHGIGRAFKAGREEMIGLLTAVQLYLAADEPARLQRAENLVVTLAERLNSPELSVQRSFPNEAGQPIARALLTFNGGDGQARRDRAVQLLWQGAPAIEVETAGQNGLYVNPITLDESEEPIVIEWVCQVVGTIIG